MWEEYFKSARIIGADINPDSRQYEQRRIGIAIGDQSNPDFLRTLGYHDIIIDDGGHTMKQQIVSFKTLWDFLLPGGIYVIEDLHTSYWAEWKDYEVTTVDYLKSLLDDVQLNGLCGYGNPMSPASKADKDGYGYHKLINEGAKISNPNIEWIHFYKSIVFIKKRG
jgi:hypothetical protein